MVCVSYNSFFLLLKGSEGAALLSSRSGQRLQRWDGLLPAALQLLLVPSQRGSLSSLYRNNSGTRNLGTLLMHCNICVLKESQSSVFLNEIQVPRI